MFSKPIAGAADSIRGMTSRGVIPRGMGVLAMVGVIPLVLLFALRAFEKSESERLAARLCTAAPAESERILNEVLNRPVLGVLDYSLYGVTCAYVFGLISWACYSCRRISPPNPANCGN